MTVTFKQIDSVYYSKTNINDDVMYACFDLDFTLIKTKSGKTFPTSKDDWKLWNDYVPETLNKFHEMGYKIIVITNQKGISTGKQTIKDMEHKWNKILEQFKLNVPIDIYIATENDKYRKPLTGLKNIIGNMSTGSIYCGDMCGREEDHSSSDLFFAHNMKLKFYTPEQLFIDKFNNTVLDVEFKQNTDNSYLECYVNSKFPYVKHKTNKNFVILVGPPASGKSTISLSDEYSSYVHLNLDILKTKANVNKLFKSSLVDNKNMILDKTNPDPLSYKDMIDECLTKMYRVHIYVHIVPKQCTYHLNFYRTETTNLKPVPPVAYNIYNKNFKIPEFNNENITISVINKIYIENKEKYENIKTYLFNFKGYPK